MHKFNTNTSSTPTSSNPDDCFSLYAHIPQVSNIFYLPYQIPHQDDLNAMILTEQEEIKHIKASLLIWLFPIIEINQFFLAKQSIIIYFIQKKFDKERKVNYSPSKFAKRANKIIISYKLHFENEIMI